MMQPLSCDKNREDPRPRIDVRGLVNLYYPPGTLAHDILVRHSESVAEAALGVAERVPHLKPDLRFIEEAAMLHDIGIFQTRSPEIGCCGDQPYIAHGCLGRRLLEEHGMPEHARVCETHVGVGLTARQIINQRLPLPARDMVPNSIEEQIICFADLFFSKTPPPAGTRHSAASVAASVSRFGPESVDVFHRWLVLFGAPAGQADEPPPFRDCARP